MPSPSSSSSVPGGYERAGLYGRQAWRTRAVVALMVTASVVTALGLRPAATSVGPVLDEVAIALHLSPTAAGFLTALPGLCFAFVGLTAGRANALTGMTGSLIIASLLSAVGMALRAFSDSWQFFILFSVFALGGAAIGNVILPAYIKAEFPRRAAPMATAYTTALAVGSSVPIFMSTIIARAGERAWPGSGWRFALGAWAAVCLVALILWLVLYIRVPHFRERGQTAKRDLSPWSLFRSSTAVALMLFFGLQSMQAYIQFGWIPSAYRAGGLSADSAAWMATIIALGGIPGGLIMPRVVAGRRWLRPSIVLFGVLLAVGYLGIAFLPATLPWLWALCLSISGFCFPTALALIIERTRQPSVTVAVSGFVQPVGYLLAATGPFLVGAAFGSTGSWPLILVVLSSTSLALVAAGWVATRNRYIDDELTGATAR